MRAINFTLVVVASTVVITASVGHKPHLLAASLAFLAALIGAFMGLRDWVEGDLANEDSRSLIMRLIAGGAFVVAVFSFGGLVVESLFK